MQHGSCSVPRGENMARGKQRQKRRLRRKIASFGSVAAKKRKAGGEAAWLAWQ